MSIQIFEIMKNVNLATHQKHGFLYMNWALKWLVGHSNVSKGIETSSNRTKTGTKCHLWAPNGHFWAPQHETSDQKRAQFSIFGHKMTYLGT